MNPEKNIHKKVIYDMYRLDRFGNFSLYSIIPWLIVVYDRWVKKKMTYNWGGISKECSDFRTRRLFHMKVY
jgi:hypothetical protein